MDKLTKVILTVIAVGVIGINVQMLNGGSGFITEANAANHSEYLANLPSYSQCYSLSKGEYFYKD